MSKNLIEKIVLSTCVQNKKVAIRTIQKIKAEQFSDPDLQRLYKLLIKMYADGKTVNDDSYIHYIKAVDPSLETAYLGIMDHYSTDFEQDISFFLDQWVNRKLDSTIKTIQQSLVPGKVKDNLALLAATMKEVAAFRNKSLTSANEDDIERNILSMSVDRYEKNVEILGYRTGFTEMDKQTDGLRRGKLVIIAARPSIGKTAFMLALKNGAREYKVRTLTLTLDTSAEDMVARGLASAVGCKITNLYKGRLNQAQWDKYREIVGNKREIPSYVEDAAGLHISELEQAISLYVHTKGVKIVFIDFIQLIVGGLRDARANMELISRTLHNLAKKLNISIVALSQLGRKTEDRPYKLPTMGDLKESSGLEESAFQIFLLYRPAYYGLSRFKREGRDVYSPHEHFQVHVVKNKQGETGYLDYIFNKDTQTFSKYEGDVYSPPTSKPRDNVVIVADDDIPF